ncbi:hypothetical protein EBZ80_00625 [bacterium]|nr:hypothetical protein [bacterium]
MKSAGSKVQEKSLKPARGFGWIRQRFSEISNFILEKIARTPLALFKRAQSLGFENILQVFGKAGEDSAAFGHALLEEA